MKFPLEFDALDLATDELKAKLLPASRRLREIEKERAERRKVRSRMKTGGAATATTTGGPSKSSGDVEMANADVGAGANVSAGGEAAAATTAAVTATTGDAGVSAATVDEAVKDKGKGVEAGELEEESVYLDREISQMRALLDPSVMGDMGGSYTGLYDLVGECLSGPNCPALLLFVISLRLNFILTPTASYRDTQRCRCGCGPLHWVCEEEHIPCNSGFHRCWG